MKRKLAAIMFTDLVGYSAISHRNEPLALELLDEHRGILRPFFPRHGGREIKTIGDAFLVEFTSAIGAVECGLEIQEALLSRNFGMPRERQIRVRIGVHLGDIVERDGDVFGDGVNIASRLQNRCESGAICFSQQIHDQVRNHLRVPVRKLRPRRMKNIPELIEAYAVRPEGPGAMIRGDRADIRYLPKKALGRRRSAALGFAGASLLACAIFLLWSRPAGTLKPSELALARMDPNRIAVLPFSAIGLPPDEAFLSEGVAEELSTTLSSLPSLRVIARTSTERYRGSTKSVAEIAEELGVGSIVEGSLLKSGDRLRVDVKFIDARTEEAVWSQQIEDREDRIFELQSKVSRAVAARLRQRKLAGVLAENPVNAEGAGTGPGHEAYLAYLKGQYFLGHRTRDSLWKALELFDSATKLDPAFPEAYVGIATGYGLLGYYEFIPPEESLKKGSVFAQKALALNPNLASALTSVAAYDVYFDHDWVGAERNFRRALELRPSVASAHEWYGEYLLAMGRASDARKEISAAKELDPLSLIIGTVAGHPDYYEGQYARAIAHYRAVLEMDQAFAPARLWLARAYILNGEARRAIELTSAAGPEDPKLRLALALAYASTGDAASAKRVLDEVASSGHYVSSYELAAIHLRLGDRAQAIADLRRAYDERAYLMVYLREDPFLGPLRKTPEIRELIKRLFPVGTT